MSARLDPCAIKLLKPVYFAYDEWEIDKRSFPLLNDVTTILFREPTLTIFITGHTDSKGSDRYNQQLSERRVVSVMQYLVDRGISPERMQAKGFGEQIPVDTNRTEEGRGNNRRVEIHRTDVPGCR